MQWLDRVKFGNGSNGAPSTITNYHNTFTGTSGQTTGTIGSAWTWNAPVIIHQTRGTGAGQWELNWGVVSGGTTITLLYPLSYTYGTGAQIVTLHQYTGGTFSGSHTGTAWNGSYGGIVALMCNGDLTVSGSINCNALGFRGGISGRAGGGTSGSTSGEGTAGASYQINSGGNTGANGNGGGAAYATGANGVDYGGGGGGANGNNGGAGKNQGTVGNTGSGSGGNAAGNSNLTSIVLGGGGGGASSWGDIGKTGGNGGGIIIIIAKNFTLTGYLTLNGENSTGSGEPSGGAGAGGSCLIKSQIATLGTNLITANGGVSRDSYNDGGAGGVGRIHIDYSDTISGTTTPTLDSAQVTTLKVQNLGGII